MLRVGWVGAHQVVADDKDSPRPQQLPWRITNVRELRSWWRSKHDKASSNGPIAFELTIEDRRLKESCSLTVSRVSAYCLLDHLVERALKSRRTRFRTPAPSCPPPPPDRPRVRG